MVRGHRKSKKELDIVLEEPKIWALRDIKEKLPSARGWHPTVVDIGYGRGEFLERLIKEDYRVIGVESSEKMLNYVKGRLGSYVDLRRRMPEERVEAVVCFEVVEHLSAPEPFLRSFPQARRYYFSTPNEDRWWVKLTGKYEPWDYPPNHVRRYNRKGLRELLEEAGFQNVRVYALPIKYHEILRPFYLGLAFKLGLQVNSECYDDVRSGKKGLKTLVELVRVVSWPITSLVAWGLNRRGYVGGNLLAVCEGKK